MLPTYRDLGKIATNDEFIVTGGSSATIIEDTKIGARETPHDPNYGLEYTAFVVTDAAGSSAAPESEYQRVSAYDETNYQWTVDTAFSAALSAGDTVALANNDIPLRTMIGQANRMLKDVGRIDLVDTTLTTANNQREYALPVTAKYSLKRVEVQGYTGDANDNQYYTVYERNITPSAPGSTGLLTLPQFASGYTIKLWYEGIHPTLTVYNSTISETIDEDMAIKGLTYYALKWFNNEGAGRDNDYWYAQMIEAKQEFSLQKLFVPVKRVQATSKFFSSRGSVTKDLPPDPVVP
jgi:hypothetical protein